MISDAGSDPPPSRQEWAAAAAVLAVALALVFGVAAAVGRPESDVGQLLLVALLAAIVTQGRTLIFCWRWWRSRR